MTGYRCRQCGNRTRFDVYERVRRRRFAHFTLGGEVEMEEEEILESVTERVECRWCDRADTVDQIATGDESRGESKGS